MAKLILHDKESDVKDGEKIKDAAESLGVQFGCEDGICGTCIIEVKEGHDNISEQNDKEKMMGLEPYQRLACQCRIKKGVVKFKY